MERSHMLGKVAYKAFCNGSGAIMGKTFSELPLPSQRGWINVGKEIEDTLRQEKKEA